MIFENPFKYRRKGDRRKLPRVYLWISGIVGTGLVAIVIAVFWITGVPIQYAPQKEPILKRVISPQLKKNIELNTAFFTQTKEVPERNPDQENIDRRIQGIKILPPLSDKPFLSAAFVSGDSVLDTIDMQSQATKLDMVFPDWFTLTVSKCTIYESIDWNAFEIFQKNKITVIPRFSNVTTLGKRIDFSSILRDKNQGACLIDTLKSYTKNRSVPGVNIDIEDIAVVDRNLYTTWLLTLIESFHNDNLAVSVSVPMNDAAFDYGNIGLMADMTIIKAYDENYLAGLPGPIAGTYWFEHSLDALLKIIPPTKILIDLGLHGYDWNMSTGAPPERKNFERIMRLAENTKTQIQWDPKSSNNNFSYMAEDGNYHEVWFLDAVSVWNQYVSLRQKQVRGMSIYWEGSEDSSVWRFIGTSTINVFNPSALHIPTKEGVRELSLSGQTIVGSRYTRAPVLEKIQTPKMTMLGISRETFAPVISFGTRLGTLWNILVPKIKQGVWYSLVTLFIVTTVVSLFRIIFLGYFVYRSHSYKKKHFPRKFLSPPPVTILVPAYNEEKVIERTILGLLGSDYPKFEILVIDDGSKDSTAECVKKVMEQHPNVRIITKKNEGKSIALNMGFLEAKYNYIVTVDADTIVLPKTIYYLMEPFADRTVDAVCGNIGVGNVKNILTAFQEVEYVTGQNFDRRAFDALNCISVVPGATGAWKKQKVLDIGGYSSDTLVEDADLTLTLLEHGGRIVYAPLARSVTEAPEMVGPLFKQRFRWSYGTFQCFWKHRRTFGKGTLGIIALPNMLFFQVIFPALSPIGDIVLFFAIFFGNLQPILIGYLSFFLMDAIVSGAAYALDKKSFANIWVIFIQRFFYRQFMYVVTFKSIIAALAGSHHGWNKLERKGTVKVSEAG